MLKSPVLDKPTTFCDIKGNEYELLSHLNPKLETILVRCCRCDYTFQTKETVFDYTDDSCPKCNGLGVKNVYELRFMLTFNEKFEEDYDLLTPYIDAELPIIVRHKVCGTCRTTRAKNIHNLTGFCERKECISAKNFKTKNEMSIYEFANYYDGSYVLKVEHDGKFEKVPYENLEQVRCEKRHRFHINTEVDYGEIKCPVCRVLESEKFKRYEGIVSLRLIKRRVLTTKYMQDDGSFKDSKMELV